MQRFNLQLAGHELIEFEALFEWALLPVHARTKHKAEKTVTADIVGGHGFKWLRTGRQAERCAPFTLAADLGWYLQSPVDVTLPCLAQVPFDPGHHPIEAVAQRLALKEVWERGTHPIGLPCETGLRRYDIDLGTHDEPMFLPNGENSWEWRLGLSVRCDTNLALLVLSPPETDGIVVPGILFGKTLNIMGKSVGLSIAVRPRRELTYRRGDDIAWLVPVDRANLGRRQAAGD